MVALQLGVGWKARRLIFQHRWDRLSMCWEEGVSRQGILPKVRGNPPPQDCQVGSRRRLLLTRRLPRISAGGEMTLCGRQNSTRCRTNLLGIVKEFLSEI